MVDEKNNELTKVKAIAPGDLVTGKVTKVEDKQVLVDVGYKFDGLVPISELSSFRIEKCSDVVAEGDELELQVLRLNDEKDELVLSKKAVDREKAWRELEGKRTSGEVLTAPVVDIVKGGLVVDVGIRGFVPASQVERHFVEDFSDYKGRTLRLKVMELDREKNRVVLSQKAVLDEEYERQKAEIFAKLEPGQVIEGTVQRLTDFGAFVDVGGVDGLVHISELAWHHVEKASDVVKEGDRVKVKVLKVDPENERISLSIKETQPGPWEQAADKFKVGDIVTGTVKRLVSFGAFVEVAPGVEGLVHISQIANRRIGTPAEVLKEGQKVQAKIRDINIPEKRISLSIREAEEEKREKEARAELEQHREEPGGMGVTIADRLGGELGEKLKNLK